MTDAKPPTEQIPAVEIYKQQYAHFGRMNDLVYKLPTIHSALIGALWFASADLRAALEPN